MYERNPEPDPWANSSGRKTLLMRTNLEQVQADTWEPSWWWMGKGGGKREIRQTFVWSISTHDSLPVSEQRLPQKHRKISQISRPNLLHYTPEDADWMCTHEISHLKKKRATCNQINSRIIPPPDNQTASVIYRGQTCTPNEPILKFPSHLRLAFLFSVHPSVASLQQSALSPTRPAFIINSCDAAQSSLAEWYTSTITNKPKYLHSAGEICIGEQGAEEGEPEPPVRERRSPALSELVLIFRWTFRFDENIFTHLILPESQRMFKCSPNVTAALKGTFPFFFCLSAILGLLENFLFLKLTFSSMSSISISSPLIHNP